jgi:acetyl-CoA decarbonylase/synthase complex subunit beta
MPPEIVPKIATEESVPDMDGLKKWLQDKDHPIVKTWKAEPEKPAQVAAPQPGQQQAAMTGFTVPTLELPASALPMSALQGLPPGMSFKIILKNAKIKAERVIIKTVKE